MTKDAVGPEHSEPEGDTSPERLKQAYRAAGRAAVVAAAVGIAFLALAGQLVRLAFDGQARVQISATAPISESYSRVPILDRDGRVLASDILLPSIIADPSRILDLEETVDRLASVLSRPGRRMLRRRLANRKSRFAWIARKVSTATAERVHNLGLPGIDFRWETKRTYPAGTIAGHVIGAVDGNNKGAAGLERYLDDETGLRMARDEGRSSRPPLRASLIIGVQHALENELSQAMADYRAVAASGIIMDVRTGEIAAAASLPEVDPAFPKSWIVNGPIDHLAAGTYELGSIFKIVTVAMALERAGMSRSTLIDAHLPIALGAKQIVDGVNRSGPIALADVFVQSSNVGAGRIALAVGRDQQRAFLSQLGLLGPIATEAGSVKPPETSQQWGLAESVTVAYGHGISIAPLQFAAAMAALVNGGLSVRPTFIAGRALPEALRKRVVSETTSATIRDLMRANVAGPVGTGLEADVPGYHVGGKTGTADRSSGRSGYDGRAVTTSFAGAFPMDAPRYVVLITLHEPDPTDASRNRRTAAYNAAPTAGAVIARVAPLLGVLPDR